MSPWSREPLQIILGPQGITWRPLGRRLALRADQRRAGEPRTLEVAAAAGGAPWQPALAALEAALGEGSPRRAVATVVLSNQFVRYVLVPWRDELDGAQEHLSYARHCLAKVYGEPVRPFELRLGQQPPGRPRLASAVDTELLEGLKEVLDHAGVGLRSIQPHLMWAFNGARRQLRGGSAWLALLEPGQLALARLQQGRWAGLRCQRLDGDWRDELVAVLEREAFFADEEDLPRDVWLGSLAEPGALLPQASDWQFRWLAAPADAPAPVAADEPAALAAAFAG